MSSLSRTRVAGLAFLLSSGLALLSGCGIGPLAPSDPVQGTGALMQGKVHGGQQPVNGASIQLWAASENGYPGTSGFTAPTVLTTPVSTGADGSFSITNTYTCPVGDAEVYITATGGNPGGGANANLALMAALGSCDSLLANASTTFVAINEVSTVVAAYALAQFAEPNPSGSGILIGTSGGNVQGLTQAMVTVNNMVNLSAGVAYTITPAYAANTVPFYNSSTVPQARINTLADILAACVNTNGLGGSSSNCSTLFTAATPSGGAAPTDTLQAILDIAQHPGPAAAPISLLSSTAPFQPTLPTAPNDWTLVLTYTGAGLGGQGTTYGITNTAMAIDAVGNIWVTAYDPSTSINDPACGAQDANCSPMIAEFSNLGEPVTQATTYDATAAPPTTAFGGYQPTSGGTNVLYPAPNGLAFDPNGNAWVGARTEVSAGLTLENYFSSNIAGPTTVDGSGDILTISANGKTLYEYSNSGTLGYSSTGGGSYGNNYFGRIDKPVIDSTGANLWTSDLGQGLGDIYRINASTGALVYDYFANGYKGSGIVADGAGNVYACPLAGKILQFNASSTSPIATNTVANGRGCGSSSEMAMDGLGQIWSTNGTILDAFTTTGVAISPAATGYTGTSTAEGLIGNGGAGMGIDGSGNLWLLNATTGAGSPGYSNVLVEYVGVAAPILTPTSQALANAQLATRP